MNNDVDILTQLVSPKGEKLLKAAADCEDFDDVKVISKLRKKGNPDEVRWAVELTEARRKAANKFDRPDELLADVLGVEQATDKHVAAYKTERLKKAGVTEIADLCCGIGGDAMSFSQAMTVDLYDMNPAKLMMAKHNCGVFGGKVLDAAAVDVSSLDLNGRVFHLDPDRRAGNKRQWSYEFYEPGPAVVEALLAQSPNAVIKLGPGVNFEALPPGEIELVYSRKTLVQAILWTGDLATCERRATLAETGDSIAGSTGGWPIYDDPRAYVMQVNAAVERAGLMHELCEKYNLVAVHPSLHVLTGDRPMTSPWLKNYKVHATMPWHFKAVKSWLADHDGGIVAVKTRGVNENTDRLQKTLRGKGEKSYVVFIVRMDDAVMSWICEAVD